MSTANNVGTVLTNAGTGAAAGATFGPLGAAIGGGVGLLAGVFNAWANEEDEKRKQKILSDAAQKLNISQQNLETMFNEYYKENNAIGTQQDVEQYQNLIHDYDPNEFVYDFDEFNYDKDVDDFYAPNKQAIIDKTSDQLQHTAAGAGIGRGTGAANQIATGVAEKNESLYRDALNAMNQDRQFAYQIWNSNIKNQQNRLNQLKNVRDTQLSMYGNLANDFQDWNANKMQQQMALEQNKANQNMQLALASI
jgi:uncharacterized protein YlbG (UPF0298 family)